MPKLPIVTGYSSNGLPYARVGNGGRILVIFDGLDFSHKPPSALELRLMSGLFRSLAQDYTVYQVRRKPNLPQGYTMQSMADDYATMIKNDFTSPVDVMGNSTGGPIALCFAAAYPGLVRRLVLDSTGCRLREASKAMMLKWAELARRGKWRAAAALLGGILSPGRGASFFLKITMWFMGKRAFGSPISPSDGIVEIMAEDSFDFRERLKDIKCPALVIGGDKDFFYDLKELADGIPGSRLVLYRGVGHNAMMKREFGADVISFLNAP